MKTFSVLVAFGVGITTLCAVLLSPSQAAEIVPYSKERMMTPPSTTEDIGLSFMKLANVKPDFEELAKQGALYKNAAPYELEEVAKKESLRIQAKYLQFNPGRSVLSMRIPMAVDFKRLDVGGSQLKIKFPPATMTYFPVFYGGYPMAVLVNGIENFFDMTLDDEETRFVVARLGMNGQTTLLLELVPLAADAKSPVRLDEMNQYPLLCDIAYIGLLNDTAEQIWAWENPKYAAMKKQNPLIPQQNSVTEPGSTTTPITP